MFRWYVINTYSGHENKVKANLEHRIESMNQRPRFRRVVVPTEQVIETKDGQKVQAEKRVLPGYVLVNMDLNDDAWTVVKNTPGVTGFVGAGAKPVPLSQPEVDRILHTGAGRPAPARAQVEFQLGESVKITSGPLADFDGEITDVNAGRPEAPGDGEHLRAAGAGRGRIRQREEARLEEPDDGEESPDTHQAPDPRRAGEPGAAGRPCARPARREHHGVLQGVQRADGRPERAHHPGRDHGLRGPLVHVHHEDAAGGRPDQGGAADRQGLGGAEPEQGRPALARPGAPDRRDEARGPERARHRPRGADHRGHRARAWAWRWISNGAARQAIRGGPRPDRPRVDVLAGRGGPDAEGLPGREVRRDRRGALPPRAERPPRRRAAARHADAAARHRQARCASPSSPRATRRARREEAGADVVGSADLAKRIEEGFTDFDVAIATPDQMGNVGRLGRDPRPARPDAEPEDGHRHVRRRARPSRDAKAGKLEYRTDRGANVHLAIGKKSFDERALVENYAAVSTRSSARSRRPRRAATSGRSRSPPRWAPGSTSIPAKTRGIVEELEEPAGGRSCLGSQHRAAQSPETAEAAAPRRGQKSSRGGVQAEDFASPLRRARHRAGSID